MPLKGKKKSIYQRNYMRRWRANEKLARWDPEKYPDKVCFDEAVKRTIRARYFAEHSPEEIQEEDKVYQNFDWQYRDAVERMRT